MSFIADAIDKAAEALGEISARPRGPGRGRQTSGQPSEQESESASLFGSAPKITEDNVYKGPGMEELAASWQQEAEGKLDYREAFRQRRYFSTLATRLRARPEMAPLLAQIIRRLGELEKVAHNATFERPNPVTDQSIGHAVWLQGKGLPQVHAPSASQATGQQMVTSDRATAEAYAAQPGGDPDIVKSIQDALSATTTSDVPLARPRINRDDVSALFLRGGTVDSLMNDIRGYEDQVAAYDSALAQRGQLPASGPTSRWNPATGKHEVVPANEGGGPGGDVGLTPVDLTGTELNYQQPSDPLRWTGITQSFETNPEGYADASAYGSQPGGGHMSLRSALALPVTKTPPEIISLQNLLIRAGFIDATEVTQNTLHFGAYDQPTQQAWKDALAAAYQDPTIPLVDMLNARAASYAPQLAAQLAEGNAGSKLVINLTDPAAVRTSSDIIAQRLIQRDLSPMEHEKLVAYVHGLQRQEGYDRQDQVYTEVDPNAALEEAIRANFDTEVQGTSAAQAFKIMSEHFGGVA